MLSGIRRDVCWLRDTMHDDFHDTNTFDTRHCDVATCHRNSFVPTPCYLLKVIFHEEAKSVFNELIL